MNDNKPRPGETLHDKQSREIREKDAKVFESMIPKANELELPVKQKVIDNLNKAHRIGHKRGRLVGFKQGIVAALDTVSYHGDGMIFKEIVLNAGKGIKAEIMRNGLPRTRKMLRSEFNVK